MTTGFKKKEDMPRTAAPPSKGNAQHSAQAPRIPSPANHSLFFIYSPPHSDYTFIIKLKVNFKSRRDIVPNLSIGQLAAKADINASTLRYYESIGLLPPPERKNGQRRYAENLIERITFIKIAQQTGFTIPEIAVLLEGFETLPLSERWEEMAREKHMQLEEKKRQINSMIQILDDGLNCKCLTWSECFIKIKTTGTCS
jgi:MerR family redox-sensitive transcriptional activator SoxR